MASWLDHFESIGENCEIGFVQRDLGHHNSSLLRWALLDDVDALAAGIQSGFEGVFALENLMPWSHTMVRDTTAGVAFHTEIRSAEHDGVWHFTTPEPERQEIHAREWRKFRYLRSKFRHDLLTGDRIYVVKRNSGLSGHDAERLLDAIGNWGTGRLLYVTRADDAHPPGTVERIDARLVRGHVDRFAPLSSADDVSLASWEAVLRAAAATFGVEAAPGRAAGAAMPASAIDSDPTRPPLPHSPDRFAKTYAALTEAIADAVDSQKERTALLAQLDLTTQKLAQLDQQHTRLQHRYNDAATHAQAADLSNRTLRVSSAVHTRMVQDLRRTAREIHRLQATALHDRAALTELARWLTQRQVIVGLLRRTPEQRLATIRAHAATLAIGPALTDDALHWVIRRRTLIGLIRRTSSAARAIVNETLSSHAETLRIRNTQRLATRH